MRTLKSLILCGALAIGLYADDKSGFFLGVEGNLGESVILQKHTQTNFSQFLQKGEEWNFDGGIKLGYQQYFWDFLGVRLGGYLGIGSPIEQILEVRENMAVDERFLKSKFLPLKAGVDLDLLFDFFHSDDHTLGLSVGVGYRYNHYFSLKNTQNFRIIASGNGLCGDFAFSAMELHEFYPQIGLHYYYEEEHQFEIAYRFGGVIKSLSQNYNQSEVIMPNGIINNTEPIQTQIQNTNYLALSYTYLF